MSSSGSDGVSLSFKGIVLSDSSEIHKASFIALSEAYLDSLIENLEERLCNGTTQLLNAFTVLDPHMAVSLSVEERAKLYDILDSHFKVKTDIVEAGLSSDMQNRVAPAPAYAFVDIPALKKELVRLTPLFSGCYSGLRFDGLARMLLIRHKDDFPQACRLCELGLSLPVSTASCERGFSLQNRIKVKSRTRLLPDNLERLIKLANSPAIENFPVSEAVSHWYSVRKRRLARLYQPSKQLPAAGERSQAVPELAYDDYEEELVGIDDVYYVL